jgi:hypothetical protein
MENPKYLVNIYYRPLQVSGQEKVFISGKTYSLPTYEGNYFIASMPEVKILATGSTYQTALDNLLIIATASTTESPGLPPLF